MAPHSKILITHPAEGICLMTLNRLEKSNALDGPTIQEWIRHLQNVIKDPTVRIVMFNGNGEHFCAGADMTWMQKMGEQSQIENEEDALQLALLLKTIYDFPKPIIGVVQGATMGGGLGIIACCDMVIAETNAVFCFSEARIGLTPSVVSPYVLAMMGERAARYYFLTAEKFNSEKAYELQLVQHIVSIENLFETALNLAKKILSNSPHALSEAKKLIKNVANKPISDELMQMTAAHMALMRSSPDAKEGLTSFLEKRRPIWK